jgi:exodeoxyribonuclease-1
VFVFYDTETTGLEKSSSQILQIALVFTDDEFNILSSKKLECRKSPWNVPSPAAMLITGFSPDDLKFNPHSHYEMMREVDGWVRQQHWPVTFIGYNNIGFDEEILANNLQQNLLDPLLTTAKNAESGQGNGRADVLAMVRAMLVYMPNVLKLDAKTAKGNVALSRITVAEQNGVSFSSDEAHDAMNDVRATIAVAKLIYKAAPQIWEQMIALSTAGGLDEFLEKNKIFTHTANAYGAFKTVVATKLAGGMVFDLGFDPAPYLAMSVDQLKACPKRNSPFLPATGDNILMPMALSAATLPKNCDEALCRKRAKMIHADKDFQARIAAAFQVEGAKPLPDKIKTWVHDFHAAEAWQEKFSLVRAFNAICADELKTDAALAGVAKFAGRIVYEHAPNELTVEKQTAMKRYIAARFLNPDINAPYMTLAKARVEIADIEKQRTQNTDKWQHITDGDIRAIKLYFTAMEKEYLPYLSTAATQKNSPPNAAPKGPLV